MIIKSRSTTRLDKNAKKRFRKCLKLVEKSAFDPLQGYSRLVTIHMRDAREKEPRHIVMLLFRASHVMTCHISQVTGLQELPCTAGAGIYPEKKCTEKKILIRTC